MTTSISPQDFFSAWRSVCATRVTDILGNWEQPADYTALILGGLSNSIVTQVAASLPPAKSWHCYREYYSLDAVFYTDEDLVERRPPGSTWLGNIRIALEHENFFESGLFQETSHLLITRADLRVLITYPENFDTKFEWERLAGVISRSGLSDPAFLLITGKRVKGCDDSWQTVVWDAFTYGAGRLSPI